MNHTSSPRTPETLAKLIDAALGREELDMLIRGGRVLDVYRGLWIDANVGIYGGRVASLGLRELPARDVLEAAGRWVVPGFFEPHFHAGGCLLSPTHLARALLERGTTSTVCDFQEHYTTCGVDAARFALDEAQRVGLRVFYLVPLMQYVVRDLGISGCRMEVEHLKEMLKWPETVGINEPPPGTVFAKDEGTLDVIAEALERGLIYSGHAPEFSGAELEAYAATGASSDHESRDEDAAWMKLGLGLKILMREGSAIPDLPRLVGLATKYPQAARHMSYCTDEVDPIDLVEQGFTDHKVRTAIAHGLDPIVALQMATLNPAEYYRIDHEIGSLAPGRFGDAVILSDLESVTIDAVVIGGKVVPKEWPEAPRDYPEWLRSTIRLPRRLRAEDFRLQVATTEARVRVMEVEEGTAISGAGVAVLRVVDGSIAADPDRDILKAAMVDPYTGEAKIGITFARGFGFEDAAVATTYQNPFWNLFVVGTDDAAIVLAANRLAELGGGIVVVKAGVVLREWSLPIAMVFSTDDLPTVRRDFEAMNQAIREIGCSFRSPVLALTFTPLVTIPAYGLTSKGPYDVNAGRFVSPLAD